MFLFLNIQLTEKIKIFHQGAVKMPLSVSFYVRVFLTRKNKNFHQAAPLPGIKGDRDLDRPWGQISQNQSENDKKEKIVQRS